MEARTIKTSPPTLSCCRCGYSLAAHASAETCPECAAPIAVSVAWARDVSVLIPNPRWTRRGFAATAFFELAFAAMQLVLLVSIIAAPAGRAPSGPFVQWATALVLIAWLAERCSWGLTATTLVAGLGRRPALACGGASGFAAMALAGFLVLGLAWSFGWFAYDRAVSTSLYIAAGAAGVFVGIAEHMLCRRVAEMLFGVASEIVVTVSLVIACSPFAVLGLGFLGNFMLPFVALLSVMTAVCALIMAASAWRSFSLYRMIDLWTSRLPTRANEFIAEG